MRYAIPVVLLLGLMALLAVGLTRDPRVVPSPLIGKPAPAFDLPLLEGGTGNYGTQQLMGQPVLVNFWASWCPPCLQEHPLLLELARSGVKIVGFNYKDDPADARQWLARHGNPYRLVVQDRQGRVGLDWGVYGAPETYVLDAQGKILHKQIGPLTEQAWREIAPMLKPAA